MIRLLLLAPLFLTACPAPQVACTTIAITSVNLQVVDESGAPVSGVVATYDRGEGPTACGSLSDTQFFCGMEESGSFVIHVEAPGFSSFDTTVEVGADECHVIGETVEAVLSPVDCTTEEVPAVTGTVAGSSGEELSNVVVSWGLANADMMPVPCDVQADGSFQCAPEQEGDIEVYASADAHTPAVQTVQVALDPAGCHVVTQNVSFALDYLPD
jgi:hypothetical protein